MTDKIDPSLSWSERLHRVIPGGAHTYSRGDDQYPANAPEILERAKGATVWAADGRSFLDYGMALRAVSIGYSEPAINQAAIRGLEAGNNLTRASTIELEAAERLVGMIDSVDMVKFTKNGSTATSAAVKLARAYTGRDLVARCAQHPFFSYDDWFIGNTPITKGIPARTIEQTKSFAYNDIGSLERLVAEHPGEIACVILEPASTDTPATFTGPDGREVNYLQQVQALCRRHGIVFILDEMITGFRWHLQGAQHTYGVTPDLCTFGKAMANGFSVAAVAVPAVHDARGRDVRPGRLPRDHGLPRAAFGHPAPVGLRCAAQGGDQHGGAAGRHRAAFPCRRTGRQPVFRHGDRRGRALVRAEDAVLAGDDQAGRADALAGVELPPWRGRARSHPQGARCRDGRVRTRRGRGRRQVPDRPGHQAGVPPLQLTGRPRPDRCPRHPLPCCTARPSCWSAAPACSARPSARPC
jgi:glutamate-1-semialdehyde 2,1-aminomutase